VGRTAEVLFEGRGNDGMMYGYTDNYIRCKAPYDRTLVNELCPVRLEGLDADGMVFASLL
jgi:threonylcarbamoyladenosine tRNA methylthiotransferase MtaB